MALPAVQQLRAAHPQAQVTVLTLEKLAGFWEMVPAIDQVLTISGNLIGTASLIRKQQFGRAIVLPNSLRSAMEVALARVPERCGVAANGRGFLLTRTIPKPPKLMRKRTSAEVLHLMSQQPNKGRDQFPPAEHHLHHYLRVASLAGASTEPVAPELRISAQKKSSVRSRFQIPENAILCGINPGAEYGPAKRWPAENFAQLPSLLRNFPVTWICFGGKADVACASALEADVRKNFPEAKWLNVAGKTTLPELCALLSLCKLVVTNDTGPMHLAAALGTRVIVPFGSTSPELTGPWPLQRHDLLLGQAPCAPCFLRECPIDLRCLRSITPQQVSQRIEQHLRSACAL
jgi:heptosyltransferase-2